MNTVYTIGYTSFKIEDFINVLKTYNINCVIDVRSTPKSSYYKDYDDVNLAKLLRDENIIYRNYKKEFGARQEDKSFYNKKGYLDFGVFAKSKQFNSGIEKIKKAQELGYNVCLMCAEKDPINCHRTILIGYNLFNLGFDIRHILFDGNTCSQEDINQRLLEKYYPRRNQLSIFDTDNITDEEAIKRSYQKRNEEIGFKLEDEE